jgi:putative alpha-1,2-mannosidase
MTRWVAQTRQNYVSMTPYNYTDTTIHGFQGTHQPAIWMGESATVVVTPGAGRVRDTFEQRGMIFSHDKETVSAAYYSVEMEAIEGGSIFAEQTACMISLSRILHSISLMHSQPLVLDTCASRSQTHVRHISLFKQPDLP